MKLDDLTVGEAKKLAQLFANAGPQTQSLNSMVGKKAIIRTKDAGIHFGLVAEKSGKEVILEGARRLWYWKAKQGISLSAVATYGLEKSSKICEPLKEQWLMSIEIIPVSNEIAAQIENMPNAKAE
jgi:hypothetical protein